MLFLFFMIPYLPVSTLTLISSAQTSLVSCWLNCIFLILFSWNLEIRFFLLVGQLDFHSFEDISRWFLCSFNSFVGLLFFGGMGFGSFIWSFGLCFWLRKWSHFCQFELHGTIWVLNRGDLFVRLKCRIYWNCPPTKTNLTANRISKRHGTCSLICHLLSRLSHGLSRI